MTLPLLLLAVACREPLLQGTLIEEEWGVRASQLDELLAVPCADLYGGDGPYEVRIDDATGNAVLIEAGRVWIRGPWGVVSDQCWWLPEVDAGEPPEDEACVRQGLQSGQCTADQDWPEGWVWSTPGVVEVPEWHAALPVDGTLLLADGDVAHRLDLTPSHHHPVDPAEGVRTYRSLLPDEPLEHRADGLARIQSWLLVWDRDASRIRLRDRGDDSWVKDRWGTVRTPRGDGVLGGAGLSWIFATEGKARLYTLDGHQIRHCDHRLLPGKPRAAIAHPTRTQGWVLLEDEVQGVGLDPEVRWPTPGAEGLLLGHPDESLPYAWGNDGGLGVLYRLEPDGLSVAWHLDEPLLGAGVGEASQELVLVTEGPEGPHVTGWLDQELVSAHPEGSARLALAAFAETPRDGDYASVASASEIADNLGICEGEAGEELVCCVHAARSARLAHNLDWLGARMQATGIQVVLGLNPAAVAQSERCQATAWADEAGRLPLVVGDWLEAHSEDASLGFFAHSSPYASESWWVRCPDADPEAVPASCWDLPVDEESYADFYARLVDAGALAPWLGYEPDWSLLGGGYEGATVEGLPGWAATFPDLPLPDGAPAEDGLYFGIAAMNPHVSAVAAKEMAPLDAREWPWPQPIGLPADDWNHGTGEDGTYWPGPSFALNRVYELRRSGLRLAEWTALADLDADWSTDRYPGDEDPERITRADLLALEHLIISHDLAAPSQEPRWWSLHLQNLASLRSPPMDEGWMDPGELEHFASRLQRWSGTITWSSHPP